MERNANYALVGAAALLLIAGLIAFLAFLAGRQEAFKDYDVYLPAPVQGLQRGAVVYFNGVQVGSVTEIQLLPQFTDRVRARIRLGLPDDGASSPIPATTVNGAAPVFRAVAQLEPQLITGISSIQVSPRLAGPRPLQECEFETRNYARLQLMSRRDAGLGPDENIEILCTAPNPLSGLLGSANGIAAQVQTALQNINTLLTPDNLQIVRRTLDNVETVTASLAAQRRLFAEVEATTVSLNRASQEIAALAASGRSVAEEDVPATLAEIQRTAAEAGRTAQEASRTAADARRLIGQLEGSATQVNTGVLPQLNTTLESVQTAADQLERVAGEIQENPRALIRRGNSVERRIEP